MTEDRDLDVAVAWSGGKDSSLGLERVLNNQKYSVKCLFTNFSPETGRSSIHGVEEDLIDKQAEKTGLKLRKFFLKSPDMDNYRKEMVKRLKKLKEEEEIDAVVYSDIFLEGIREERRELLEKAGLKGIWPIWHKDTGELLSEFEEKFGAYIVCVDLNKAPRKLAGSELNTNLMSNHPDIDPCGEKGEFHSFVYSAPYYSSPIKIEKTRKVEKDTKEEGKSLYQGLKLKQP